MLDTCWLFHFNYCWFFKSSTSTSSCHFFLNIIIHSLRGQRFLYFKILTQKVSPWTDIACLFLLVLPGVPALWLVTAHGLGIMDDLQGVLCTRGIKRGLEVIKKT